VPPEEELELLDEELEDELEELELLLDDELELELLEDDDEPEPLDDDELLVESRPPAQAASAATSRPARMADPVF